METRYKELREAFLDALDGNYSWKTINRLTGLPETRCLEIENLFLKLSKEHESEQTGKKSRRFL